MTQHEAVFTHIHNDYITNKAIGYIDIDTDKWVKELTKELKILNAYPDITSGEMKQMARVIQKLNKNKDFSNLYTSIN
jgi:hypothetical protein